MLPKTTNINKTAAVKHNNNKRTNNNSNYFTRNEARVFTVKGTKLFYREQNKKTRFFKLEGHPVLISGRKLVLFTENYTRVFEHKRH